MSFPPQAVLGIMIDVPKQDAVRTARTAPLVIKGQEELVKRAKPLIESIGKGTRRWQPDACGVFSRVAFAVCLQQVKQ